jgi:hypothetical protein
MPKTATAGEPDPNDDVEERARDQALNALELPGHGYELSTTRIALRDAFDYLRGQGQATAKEFKQEVYPQTKADTYFDTPLAWWRDGCKPYLRQLPGVVPPSGTGNPWRFDSDRVELPDDEPDAPDISPDRKLTEAEVGDAVNDLDLPGRTPITKAKHCAALRNMVLLLQEHGLATREELRECYDPTAHNEPQQGMYADREQWWREVGEPNLRAMPGVEAPDAAGDCWRFVGVA